MSESLHNSPRGFQPNLEPVTDIAGQQLFWGEDKTAVVRGRGPTGGGGRAS
jgi:hypothetical protein